MILEFTRKLVSRTDALGHFPRSFIPSLTSRSLWGHTFSTTAYTLHTGGEEEKRSPQIREIHIKLKIAIHQFNQLTMMNPSLVLRSESFPLCLWRRRR